MTDCCFTTALIGRQSQGEYCLSVQDLQLGTSSRWSQARASHRSRGQDDSSEGVARSQRKVNEDGGDGSTDASALAGSTTIPGAAAPKYEQAENLDTFERENGHFQPKNWITKYDGIHGCADI